PWARRGTHRCGLGPGGSPGPVPDGRHATVRRGDPRSTVVRADLALSIRRGSGVLDDRSGEGQPTSRFT
ncbi:MAG TPA: hypothetical protein VGF17_02435, partial [Phytomonospora sp.]